MVTVVFALFGLLWGSFANVLIARVPEREDWVSEPSRCPECRTAIAWHDNIPVVSWLILRARCRQCGTRISAQYPAVEIATALLFAAVGAVYGLSILGVMLALLATTSVALTAIDFQRSRLPDPLVYGSLAIAAVGVGVWVVVDGTAWDGLRALVGMVVMGGYYFILWFIKPGGLGFGDVKASLFLGLVLGALGWAALAVGAIAGPLLGGVAALVAVVRARRLKGLRIPFGPWLIAGAWVGILAGDQIGAWYLDAVLAWS